jgi:hypothetical protein
MAQRFECFIQRQENKNPLAALARGFFIHSIWHMIGTFGVAHAGI